MSRKRITQRFPWLLPIRKRQRLFFFYMGMRLDGRRYAGQFSEALLPCPLFESGSLLYNRGTGFDMIYQENKVFNLKLAAAALNHLLIRPGETFSFWRLVRRADRRTPYREGLTVVNGEVRPLPGGGLCQLSSLLFWLFLHSPLTLVERHGHRIKDFPDAPSPEGPAPIGVDATVSEGWLDLKVRNDTPDSFQLELLFTEDTLLGRLRADAPPRSSFQITSSEPVYYRQEGRLFQETDVFQSQFSHPSGEPLSARLLYRNRCEIGYPLPEGTPVSERPSIFARKESSL